MAGSKVPARSRETSIWPSLRTTLLDGGLDAGPHSICWHRHHGLHHDGTDLVPVADPVAVAPATVWRILHRHHLVIPEPKKRPKASLRRFEAELPNLTWQTDTTHVRLADGTDTETDTEDLLA